MSSGADAAKLDTLATADKAIKLARRSNAQALASRIAARRSLYEQGQPFRSGSGASPSSADQGETKPGT